MGHSQYFSSKDIVFTKGFLLQSISIDPLVSLSFFVSLRLRVSLEGSERDFKNTRERAISGSGGL